MNDKKTIMLLFLSDVKVGTDGQVSATKYPDIGDVKTTNESAVRYVAKQEGKLDHLFIFASKLVKNNITYQDSARVVKDYIDTDGKLRTHINYFKERITDILDNQDSNYTEVDFNENSNDAMESILDMANKVQEYIAKIPDAIQVTLHVDFTGGLRHANMMMMAVLRILQYNGVPIGDLLYSKYDKENKSGIVEKVDSIYDLFDFVSGAEEFANFGSANAINHYFVNKEKPKVLEDLLGAMNKFSEEIRLCHRGRLESAAKELKNSKDAFDKYKDSTDNNIRLVQQLKTRIDNDYKDILTDDLSVLNLIKWCLQHDYLQQALTLYVEGIPDYLYERKFFQLSDDSDKQKTVKKKKKGKEEYSDGFFMLSVFDGKSMGRDEKGNTYEIPYKPMAEMDKLTIDQGVKLMEMIKRYIPKMHNKDASIDIDKLKKDVDELNSLNTYIYLTNPEKLLDWFATLEKWRQNPALLKNPDKDDIYYAYFDEKLKLGDDFGVKKYNKIISYFENVSQKEIKDFLTDCKLEYAFRFMSFCEPEQNYFKLNLPKDIMRKILNDYGYFKSERNASNHARMDDEVITAEDLKEKMTKAVDYIIDAEQAD